MPEREPWEISTILNAQVEAAQHIRDCSRCRRLFRTAYEATFEVALGTITRSLTIGSLPAWSVTNETLPELRRCTNWPIRA